jgi:hypothetical protein
MTAEGGGVGVVAAAKVQNVTESAYGGAPLTICPPFVRSS